MKDKLIKFMYGRYGNDELNQFLFKVIFVLLIVSLLLTNDRSISDIIYFIALILVFTIYFRMFSKDYNKRYNENRKFIEVKNKFLQRDLNKSEKNIYRYYKCPSCKQKVRIPKGKGKVSIHCPKCNIDFIKRS